MGNTNSNHEWRSYPMSEERLADDPHAMLHQLRVRQIALEMRNEELEEANRRLTAERRRFARLFDSAPVGQVTLDSKGEIVDLNLTASDLLKKPRRELLHTSLYHLLDKNSRDVLYTHLRTVMRNDDVHVCNLKLNVDGGPLRYVQLRTQRDTLEGAGHVCYSAIIDVTKTRLAHAALAEAKELNEDIVDSISESLIVVDRRLRVLQVNPAFVRTFGIEAKDAEGRSLLELETGIENDRALRKRITSLNVKRADFSSVEVAVDIPGRGRREISVEAKPLTSPTDSPHNAEHRTLFVIRDLTEQKKTERQMRRVMRELEESNNQLSNYTSVVSHDLRAPLQIAQNYVRYLKEDLEGTLQENQAEYLDGIEASLGLAGEMVSGLLTLSRIRSSDLTCKRIYLGPFIRKVVDQIAAASDAEISMYSKWPAIVTEPVLLQQIVMNLLDNAIKYNNSEKKQVELTWRELPEDSIELAIKDNGPGIRPAQREKIFKAFTRLHSSESVRGSGLGLSIVRTAAGRLGGSVSLESEVGEGTAFYVRIPRHLHEAE